MKEICENIKMTFQSSIIGKKTLLFFLLNLSLFGVLKAQEPSEDVTNLATQVLSDQSIQLTWTASGGTNLPSHYLIVAYQTTGGTPVAVADATLLVDDTDFTGPAFNGQLNITFGTNQATFTTLLAGTNYTFKVYPYKTGGTPDPDFKTAAPATITASTFSAPATTQVTVFSATPTSSSTLNLAWTVGDGSHTIILAKSGSAVGTDNPVNGTTYAANPAFGSGDVVAPGVFVVFNNTNATAQPVTITGLTPGTTYHFAAYTYNYNSGVSNTENYLTAGIATSATPPTPANTSTLTLTGTPNATVSSIINTSGAAKEVIKFIVDDIASDDFEGMVLTQMTFTQGTGNDITKWDEAIAGVVLTDGTNTITLTDGVDADLTINPTNLVIANIPASLGTIAVDGSKTYTLKIWLKSNLSGTQNYNTTIDGLNFVFALNANTNIVGTGSGFAASQNIKTAATDNEVTVVATAIKVVQQPSTSVIRTQPVPQQPSFQAVDANNNRDLGFNNSLTSVNTSPNLGPASLPASFSSGTIDFTGSGFKFNNLGTSTMTVTANGITSNPATNSITVKQNVTVVTNTSGLASAVLGSPVTSNYTGLVGFNVKTDVSSTTTTLTGFTITTSSTPLDKFTNPRVVKSNNSSLGSSDTPQTASVNQTASGYVFSGMSIAISNNSNTYLFVVVDVLSGLTGATETITLTVDPSTFIFSTPNAGSFSAQWNSDTFSFEDVAVPVIASLNPVNGALAVPINANLQITFTEAVKKTTSTTPKVKIYQNGVGSPIATYTAKSAPELTLSGGDLVLTINPADFLPGTEYYVIIDDGAFLDLQDNNFAGIDNSTVVWAFKTYAPPVIASYNPESCINNTITITGQNFAGYPGDVIGVTKVEFTKSGGGVTNGTLTFVSDTEIQVGIPSNAVTGPISVYKGTDVSNSTALAIPDINLDFTIGITNGDLSVCSLESNLIYSVDTDLVDYSDLSYNWTLSSNILPVIKADVNAILVNVGTGSGASTISVNKTRVSDGCVSNTYNFNITVHPKPTVIFDPITSHSNLNQNGYTLVLKNGSSTPIANGKEPLFPFVTFSGNGVTKELNSPDDIFKFNSYNLPVADHTVSYYYMDGNQCEVTGNKIFNVYDGTSTIGGLSPDYCNYDIAAYALTPLMEPGSTLSSMEVLDADGVVHTSGSGWGLNGVAPNYTFTPSEAATHMGTNKFITINFRYTYITPALAVITKENIYSTIFDRPDADFELTVGDNNIFRVDKLLNLQLCENSIPITLTPISTVVPGSTVNFTSDNSGNPITGDVFDPSVVSFSDINRVLPEQVNVTFTYTEDMGSGTASCSNTKVLPIKVYPQPAVPTIQEFNGTAFGMDPQAPTDPLICVTSVVPTAQIIDKHTNDALTTVAWFTNEEGTGNPASIQDTYKADINTLSEGDGNYRYLFQTYDKFCRSDRLRMNYEYFPNLNFTTSSNVLTADPVLTSEFGSIVPSAYAWDVVSLTDNTPITVPTVQNPTLSGLANDIYQVSLTIQSTNGCSASLPKNMMFFTPIQPNIPGGILGDATYQFNFGDSNFDWFSVTDYQKGDTYKKLSGGNLWVHTNNLMGNTQYNTNTPDTAIYWSTVIDINNKLPTDTAGFLVSPSFNLSNYLRPMVSFNAHYTLDDEDDGVVLQYTNETLIDEDTQWKTIGSVQSGVNWFNLSGISTTPGNQVVNIYGWSNIRSKEVNSTKGGWLESKHQLGSVGITDFSNVIFRFSLATDNKAETRPNGFAISDFFIGNRTRTVLVENFANSGGGTDVNNENTLLYAFANNVNNEIQDNNTDILLLNYRTPFPDTFDELYKKNPADHGVRVDFYNINDIPRSRIDGYEGKPNLPWSAWGEREYNVRSLELAQMNIDISTTVNFNGLQAKSLSITAALTPRVDIPENAVMIMAVVDKMIDPAYGTTPSSGEVQVQNLVRKILPDGAGHRFPNGIPVSGGTQQITYEYYFEPDIDPTNLAIIVFIQDFAENGRKEVYQSEFYNVNPADIGTTITGINDINLREISLYPVPANDFTKLALNKPLYSDSKVRLFDNLGKEVWNGSMNSGTNTLDLNTSRFASGVYIIQIESDSELIGHERLIIKH